MHHFLFFSSYSPIFLRLHVFYCRVYVRPFCPLLDIAISSRSAAITVWPSFSSIYPALSRYASYLPTYLCVYVCLCVYTHPTFETISQTSSFVVPSNFCVFATFSSARLHPARPKRIRFSARKGFPSIHANFNLFGCASRPLPRWGKSAFDDDNGEINETIGLRVTFKSRLLRRRSSLGFTWIFSGQIVLQLD